MDTKSFISGAVLGIAASTLIFWLLHPPQDQAGSDHPDERIDLAGADSHRMQEEAREPPRAASEIHQHAELDAAATSSAEHPASARRPIAGKPDDDERLPGELLPWPPSRVERSKEPKDSSWSHYMEQTLRQYLARHSKATQFDFVSIDCRTTFCEVQAIGFDKSTSPVWGLVMYDLQQQPWNEFDMSGSTYVEQEDGRPLLIGTLHRRMPQ